MVRVEFLFVPSCVRASARQSRALKRKKENRQPKGVPCAAEVYDRAQDIKVKGWLKGLCPQQGARVADAVPLTNLQYTPTRANSKIRIPCTNWVICAVDGGKPSAGAKTSVKLNQERTAAKSVLSEQLRESR